MEKGDVSALPQIPVNVWSKLYHRKLFDSIQYPVGHVYEDVATTHRILYSSESILLLDLFLYNYASRSGSITETEKPENQKDFLRAISLRHQDFKLWGVDTSKEFTVAALKYLIKNGRKANLSDYWSSYLRRQEGLPEDVSWKLKVALPIYQISPLLFDIACFFTKRRKPLATKNIHKGAK